LIKSLLIYSVSYLNLEGLNSPMLTVATGLLYISLVLSLLNTCKEIKSYNHRIR